MQSRALRGRYCIESMKNAFLAALLLAGCRSEPALTIAAASSLQDALREIGARYEAKTHERVAFDFAASNVLARTPSPSRVLKRTP